MNTSSINSTETTYGVPADAPREPFTLFVDVLTALTVALIVTLNPLCLVVLPRASGIQETTKLFMASLTVSDLCIGLFWAFPQMTADLSGTWLLGDFLCTVWGITSASFFTLSIFSLLLLTVDRFIAIVHSLHYPTWMTLRRSVVIVAITWALTLTFYIVLFGITAQSKVSKTSPFMCEYAPCDVCLYQSVFTMTFSLGTIMILYIYILNVARRQARLIAAQHSIGNVPGEQNAPQRVSTKSATTVFIITATVFLSWMPTIGLFVIIPRSTEEPVLFIRIANISFFTNSWLNVVIYYWRNKELRQALHSLVASCCH